MPIGRIAFVVHRDLSFGLPLRFMASLAHANRAYRIRRLPWSFLRLAFEVYGLFGSMPIGFIAFVVHRDLSFGLPLRFMASLAQCLIRLLMKLVVTLSSFVAYQAFRYRYHSSLPIRPFVIVIVSLPIRPFVSVIIARCWSGLLLRYRRSMPIRLFDIVIVVRCLSARRYCVHSGCRMPLGLVVVVCLSAHCSLPIGLAVIVCLSAHSLLPIRLVVIVSCLSAHGSSFAAYRLVVIALCLSAHGSSFAAYRLVVIAIVLSRSSRFICVIVRLRTRS